MCAFSIVFLTLSLLYFYLIWMDLCWSQSDCRCICISNDSIWMGLLRGEPAGLPCLLLSVRPGSSICELLLPSQRLPRFFNFQIFACFLSAVLCMWSALVLSNCLATWQSNYMRSRGDFERITCRRSTQKLTLVKRRRISVHKYWQKSRVDTGNWTFAQNMSLRMRITSAIWK